MDTLDYLGSITWRQLIRPVVHPECSTILGSVPFVLVPLGPNQEIALILGVLSQTETIVLERTDPGAVGTGIPS